MYLHGTVSAQQLRHWEKLSISPGGLCAAKGAEAVTLLVGGCFKRPPAQPGSAHPGHQEVPQ